MSDDKRDPDPLRDGAREAARAVSGAGRKLAQSLRDLTKRPDDEEEPENPDEEDLGDKVKELGRDFLDVMGRVSVTAGKKLRRAAYDASETVRGAIDGARASRTPTDSDTAASDNDPDDPRD